jgi:hypothetical protein
MKITVLDFRLAAGAPFTPDFANYSLDAPFKTYFPLVAVPALLRTEWWPMISFVVFKSPAVGGTHIFRPGEPMLQILIVPVTSDFTLVPMDEEETAKREMRGRRIHASRPTRAADSTWTSDADTMLDGTYRHLSMSPGFPGRGFHLGHLMRLSRIIRVSGSRCGMGCL